MSSSRSTFLLLVAVVACAPAIRSNATEPVITERLYFGRTIADSGLVTDSAWAAFVSDVVTARFPSGFTFWPAEGQWRGADGRSGRERSFVLEVVHPSHSAAADSGVAAIVAEYKRRFNQESVLRVITSGRASF